VISPPATLQNFPSSYLTAFYLPSDKLRLPDELVERFPNLTVIDVTAVLSQFKEVLDQLARAIEAVFVFSLLCGVAVLLAALSATHDERRHELAVLRTLGAGSKIVLTAQSLEFLLLGWVAATLGAGGALVMGWGLSEFVFKFPYQPSVLSWLIAMGLAALGILLAGLLGTRRARRASIQGVLRA
jgi:putative ABC transport system permease protein